VKIFGVDFSSSPSRRKPVVVARTELSVSTKPNSPSVLALAGFEKLETLDAFAEWLNTAGPWIGGFDFPFALPRELLIAMEWPPYSRPSSPIPSPMLPWSVHIEHLEHLSRAEMVNAFKKFCADRPPGGKFAHRACDIPAGASPSMKWVNPPVAFMLHAGATRLHRAGVSIPGLKVGDRQRIALEAYPGYLARLILVRESYKSDDLRKQNEGRLQARRRVIEGLCSRPLVEIGLLRAAGLGLRVELSESLKSECLHDASGDHLDAWLCAIQASVGYLCEVREPGCGYGMGAIDPLEGWIVGVMRD
jgi:hypothetical protein